MAVNERVARDRQIETIRSLWLTLLGRYRAIAIIRAQTVKTGVSMAKAAAAGGFCLIEVAWNHNADPAEMIAQIRAAVPHCVVGVGTILSEADLIESIAAQAQFCFTPHTDSGLIDLARSHQIPMIAGAMTPTEIVTAWQAGAASVKVFPISSLGNSAYIRSILGPLKSIPLVPTGGVSCESAPELIKAGAVAVGLSTALFPPDEVSKADWAAIEARSRYLLTLLSNA